MTVKTWNDLAIATAKSINDILNGPIKTVKANGEIVEAFLINNELVGHVIITTANGEKFIKYI